MADILTQDGIGNLGFQNVRDSKIEINQYLGKSLEYGEMQKRLKELEENLADVAPDRVERLNDLNEKIALQKKHIEQFKQGVLQLAETFSRIDVDTTDRLKRAREFFEKGEFGEARAVMEIELEQMNDEHTRLLDQKEKLLPKLRHNAEEFLVLAQTTAMNFDNPSRFEDTCKYFEQSIAAFPFIDNLFNYAKLLQDHNQFHAAEPYYRRILNEFRNDLSVERYAGTLNNLAVLHDLRNEHEAAEAEYAEILAIYRELAVKNREATLPAVAMTLNNLAVVHDLSNKYEAAEAEYAEALALYRELAEKDPQTYLLDVAMTLNNLAILHRHRKKHEAAEAEFTEALAIRRELAEKNPQTYLPKVAMTLNNLAILHRNLKEHEAAEKEYGEALKIYQELAEKNPQAYLPNVAVTLNNLANLHSDRYEFEAAEVEYNETLAIYRELAEKNPQAYLPYVAMTLGNQAIFYQAAKSDKERSIALAIEAVHIIQPFFDRAAYTQKYLDTALAVLKKWGLTDKEIEEKLAE